MSENGKPKCYPTPGLVGFDPTGVTWHDLSVLENPRYPQAERVAAVEWVAKCWYGRPIAPQRWQAIGPGVRRELDARAEAHGTTPEEELKRSVVNSLLLAVDDAGGIFNPGPRKVFHRKLNDLVTEDLLGPSWRKKAHEAIGELENVLAEQFEHGVETAIDLDALISKAELGKREAEIVAAVRQGERLVEVADRLGIKKGTARVALHRACKKMQIAM